jgi:hypothetical protein
MGRRASCIVNCRLDCDDAPSSIRRIYRVDLRTFWDVSKRPETRLKRPNSSDWLGCHDERLGVLTHGCACVSAAMLACDEASRVPATRMATHEFERVRAFRRATRSAIDSGSSSARWSAVVARLTPHRGGRSLTPRLQFDGRGPSLLTEDRQKPRRRLEGMHGTRNTVPSRAVNPR